MHKVKLRTETITDNRSSYDLEYKESPTFYNLGTTEVKINRVPVLPGELKEYDYPGRLMTGTIEIEFIETGDPADVNNILVEYGEHLQINPNTGNPTNTIPGSSCK